MKRVLLLVLSLALCAGLMVGCGQKDSGSVPVGGSDCVYYLNPDPEAETAWKDLARIYAAETGVEVKIVTPAPGEYNDTLIAEMAKTNGPTLFQCSSAQSLLDWGDYCLDLTGSKVLGEMTTGDLNLMEDGAVKAIGYCYEAFGIIVNKELLKDAGYKLTDITDFASLKKIAEDIHARADRLGFDAFAFSGLDDAFFWNLSGHLANMPLYYEFRDDNVTAQPATITGAYLKNYRNIWDLYINNSAAAGDESRAQFGTGRAVFWQQGTGEFVNLTGGKYNMDPANLAMIPIYCGVEGEENAGLCCGNAKCWAVNAKADKADIEATLDFLYWVVASDAGTGMMADRFGAIPFKNAKESANIFLNDANAYMSSGNYTVTWAFSDTPNIDTWRDTLAAVLAAYSENQTDSMWDAVKTVFVEGWAYEYHVQNGS